jgi:hypothetical protein
MDERDPAYDYDGGWEEGIDTGEGLSDHLLGPVDPYNRKDHYTPHPRFATRPEMRWIKAEDPIENLPSGHVSNKPGVRRRPSNCSQPETRGERLARQKGHSRVTGITLKQAKALPDLGRSAARDDGGQPRKEKGARPKQRAAKQATAASSGGRGKNRRQAAKARRERASMEQSMQRARLERQVRDRLLADQASTTRWDGVDLRSLGGRNTSIPEGVCRSCSRSISPTGQCACS